MNIADSGSAILVILALILTVVWTFFPYRKVLSQANAKEIPTPEEGAGKESTAHDT